MHRHHHKQVVRQPPHHKDPYKFLTGIVIDLDPARESITLTSGAVEAFGSISQGTAANRALWSSNDGLFKGRPVATFDGTNDVYALGNLSALTAGELFAVIKLDADPAVSLALSGWARIGNRANGCHVPYTDGVIYETFGTTVQVTAGNPSQSMANPCLYNTWNAAAGDYAVRVNRGAALNFTSAAVGAPAFSATAVFGDDGTERFKGRLARLILCNAKQSTSARTQFENFSRIYYNV